MKRVTFVLAAAIGCAVSWNASRGLGVRLPGEVALGAQAAGASQLVDWLTDGGDNQRTGWAKNEKILTKQNVGSLKLLWTLETGNQPRALHSLMPVLVIAQLPTAAGVKQVGIVNGISDNLYGFDVETGKLIWQKHWTYVPPAGRGGGGGGQPTPQDPRKLGFLQPGGSSDTPVIGPADAQGRRPVYFVSGDGMFHTLNAATGEDLEPPFMFHTGKGWSLTLDGRTIWMANTYAGISVAAVNLDDPQHKVMTFNAGSGGAWGRRGVTLDSTGTAWTTTGDGVYDPTSDPARYANSVVGVHLVNGEMKLKDYYTPKNWDWLRKRDLDPNNTPTIFNYKGRELIAASGKECRVYLLDPKSAGGADHQTPLYKTPLFCNEEVDFQDMGSWGALSTWEEANGTRWVLAPFWGPVHSQVQGAHHERADPERRGRGSVQGGRGRRTADAHARLGRARHAPGRAGHHRQRRGLRLWQRRGNQAVLAGHRPAVRFLDPGGQGPARDHLRARRLDREGALDERRPDEGLEPLLRHHRRQWPRVPRDLRGNALLLRGQLKGVDPQLTGVVAAKGARPALTSPSPTSSR